MFAANKIVFYVALIIQLLIINGTTGDKLIFSQIVYRHGDRAINAPYPNDPNKDESLWPEGFGQLSNLGKMQHYELGKFFRARYARLLGNGEYSAKKVFIQSSDLDRAIQSAGANAAGLFPPTNKQIWNANLLWQPVPVHTLPADDDNYIAGVAECPRFNLLMKQVEKKIETDEKYKKLLEYVTEKSGYSTLSINNFDNLNNILSIEKERNMTMPAWTKDLFNPGSTIKVIGNLCFSLPTATPELSRLKHGHLLRRILDRFNDKIKKTLKPDRTLWIYSGHDFTIVSLLNILGLYETQPPYAAALMFELYESGKGHYIKLYYKTSPKSIQLMNIPKCGVNCTLKNYYLLFKHSMPDSVNDWKKACEL